MKDLTNGAMSPPPSPPDWTDDQDWSVVKIQPLAIAQIYSMVWPEAQVIPLDNDRRNTLKYMLDVAGADKLIRWPDGGVAFLGQRFRRYEKRQWDDFTLRARRPSGRETEIGKIAAALDRAGLVAGYYAYGHVNEKETGFLRFRILEFRAFCQDWQSGLLPAKYVRHNKDGSSSFYCWPFSQIPSRFFVYNSEAIQMHFQQFPF